MKSLLVFYFPYLLETKAKKGSQVRPLSLFNSLKNKLGESILLSSGKERNKTVTKNLSHISHFYMESINRPLFINKLINKELNFLSDYILLIKLKKRGVKLSIFYRDAYWAKDLLYLDYSIPFAILLKFCYKIEWIFFKNIFDVIFLPSLELLDYMDENKLKQIHSSKFYALPPGVKIKDKLSKNKTIKKKTVNLLFVGGISPDLYDISYILNLIKNNNQYQIRIITHLNDVKKFETIYHFTEYKNLEVISATHNTIQEHYSWADASILFFKYSDYRNAAMPFKFFESIQYHTPIICNNDSLVGKITEKNNLGISVNQQELQKTFQEPQTLLSKLEKFTSDIDRYIGENTWEKRTNYLLETIGYNFS